MIEIDGSLTVEDVVVVARDGDRVTLAPKAATKMKRSRAAVEEIVHGEESVYGVNTGFGDLQDVSVSEEKLNRLQENMFRSHATAVGDTLPREIVRAAMLIRANALAIGVSGVRVELVEQLLTMLNEGVHPIVPADGSTDDLGAMAHIGLVLIGEGEARVEPRSAENSNDGDRLDGVTALDRVGIEPLSLAPKEGLAAISGTPVMTSLLAFAVHDGERLVRTADLAGAWTFSLLGNEPKTFAKRANEMRPHDGQVMTAANVRSLLGEFDNDGRETAQDPLSLRCIPQVHGAVRDHLTFARDVVETELQSATDNPLVFPDGEVFSCGNFNGQQISSAADMLATSIAKLGSASERRTNQIVSNADDCMAFLAAEPGLESGMMIAHYTSTGLIAETDMNDAVSNRTVTVSGGQEDIHSMGTIAARSLRTAIKKIQQVLAIELLCTARYTRLDDTPELSEVLSQAHETFTSVVDTTVHDEKPLAEEIEAVTTLIANGTLLETPHEANATLD